MRNGGIPMGIAHGIIVIANRLSSRALGGFIASLSITWLGRVSSGQKKSQ